jgi:hypothetical protein
MKILITGGLGFVGTLLSSRFLEKEYEVTVVDHSPTPGPHTPPEVRYVPADTTMEGAWQDELRNQDVVINLAGASIFQRWNDKYKKLIYESRIVTTRNVVAALPKKEGTLLCSTSAVGYYGFRGDEELTEEDHPGGDFLAKVCVAWEREALRAADKGIRVVVTRFGIVLGKTGGALGQMIPVFKKFVGGPFGNGAQWFSWIHTEDLVSAFLFVIDHRDIHGPVNFASPNPVRNRELAKALGTVLSRPSFLKTPGFMLRLVLGEFGLMLLKGQKVKPARLINHGFVFRYPQILGALHEAAV